MVGKGGWPSLTDKADCLEDGVVGEVNKQGDQSNEINAEST
jgi:hypothetical protein